MELKLGKLAPKHDHRDLLMANYTAALAAPPKAADWTDGKKAWGMMMNDKIGDCACAGPGHLIMARTAVAKKPIVPTDQQILAAYEAISGYNPKTGANDNGCVLADVMKYWQNTGIANDKIAAYVATEPHNRTHVEQSIAFLEGAVIGLALPISAQAQVGRLWTIPSCGLRGPGAPGSWGGHCVIAIAYTASQVAFITWGGIQWATWQFWDSYCDESWATVDMDMLNGTKTPTGFDWKTLVADLAAVRN